MRNPYLLLLLLSYPAFSAYAQNAGNIWYFGDHAGIDFSSGNPVSLSNSTMHIFEGCATVCDANGNLLFNENNENIWNSNHQIMSNGSGLDGDTSSAQSLIVRNPDSCNIYYVFTMQSHLGGSGLAYSKVDMNLNGGLGDVVSGQKNIVLIYGCCEGITASLHQNGHDVWVIAHPLNSANLNAFIVTSSGVNPVPVVASIGPYRSSADIIGQLKASHKGDKVAMVNTFNITNIDLFNFDQSTGIFSNDLSLEYGSPFSVGEYGIEFSPNDSLLYVSSTWVNNILAQYNIFGNSWYTITSVYGNYIYGALQLAPDGKIYMAHNGAPYLDVINAPNSIGAACNFVSQGLALASGTYSLFGLPNEPSFIYQGFFNDPCVSNQNPFTASDTLLCEKFCTDFFAPLNNNATSWMWTFPAGNPASSTDQNPTNICYQVPGVYDVTLISGYANGTFDTLTLADYITVYTNPFAPTITQIGNILTSSSATTYQWQLNYINIPGATYQSYTITQSGLYSVVITNPNGCTAISSIDAGYVGVNEIENNNGVSIYYDQANHTIAIDFKDLSSQAVIYVIDQLGQLVFSSIIPAQANGGRFEINTLGLTKGAYLISVSSADMRLNRKILIY